MSMFKRSSQRSWNRRPLYNSGIRASVKRPHGFDYRSRDNTEQCTWHHGESSRISEDRTSCRNRLGVASAVRKACLGGRFPHRFLPEPYNGDQAVRGSSSGTQNWKDKLGLMRNFQHKDMADWDEKNYNYAIGKGKKALTDKFHIQCFNCANFGHFANRCPSRNLFNTKAKNSEFLVLGTEQKTWNDMWFLNIVYDDHTCFNKNLFSEFMDLDSIPMDYDFEMDINCKGVGEVMIENGENTCLIPCVQYKPNTTKNILSMATLIKQGFMVKLMGDKASIKPMFPKEGHFSTVGPSNKIDCSKDNDDFLQSQNVTKVEKEKLDAFIFTINTIEDCILFLDLLEKNGFLEQLKATATIIFERLVEWFHNHFLRTDVCKANGFNKYIVSGKVSNLMPPKLPNGTEICLLDLYMLVKIEGGYMMTTKKGGWINIANQLGLKLDDWLDIKKIYLIYLDSLEWYHKIWKCEDPYFDLTIADQEKKRNPPNSETNENDADPQDTKEDNKTSSSEESDSSSSESKDEDYVIIT